MIIKPADDRTRDIEALQGLLAIADAATCRRIEQEIRQIKAGIRGEEEAAYEMRVHWGDHPGRMILHDLRIEHDGLVAQIDHLMIDRLLDFWVCESKHFAEGVAINEQGEFTAFFGRKPYGVPSPIEQNAKHIAILGRFLNSGVVKLPTRLGFAIKPSLRSLVLVSKSARISRPKAKIPGLEALVKNDQMFQAIDKAIDESNPLTIAKVVSAPDDSGSCQGHRQASQAGVVQLGGKVRLGLACRHASGGEPALASADRAGSPCNSCNAGHSARVDGCCTKACHEAPSGRGLATHSGSRGSA